MTSGYYAGVYSAAIWYGDSGSFRVSRFVDSISQILSCTSATATPAGAQIKLSSSNHKDFIQLIASLFRKYKSLLFLVE